MINDSRIGIIGAGIGGLAAALALQRAGLNPVVYEQAHALGDIGAGISITPNAAIGLQFLGLGEQLHAAADRPPQQLTRHYRSGEVLLAIDRSDTTARYGAEYYQMHRGDLHALLLDAVTANDSSAVRAAHRLVKLSRRDQRVAVAFANGAVAELDCLIGADGLRSVVREAAFGGEPARFAGFVAWRGMVPNEALAHLNLGPASSVFAGGQRLFVRYPVRRGSLLNYVAFTKTAQAQAESWTATTSIDELLPLFADFHPEVSETIRGTVNRVCGRWGLYARPPLSRWVSGTIALLGDAAHPMLPWFGQGAAAAIEDAVILGRAVAMESDVVRAFELYERARQPRASLLYRESSSGGDRIFVDEPTLLTPEHARNEDSLGIFRYNPATAPI